MHTGKRIHRKGGGWAWAAAALPLLLYLVVPVGYLALGAAPADVWQSLGQPAVRQAVGLSFATSLCAAACSVVLGAPLAVLSARATGRRRTLLDAVIDLPIVLPPAVAGVALLVLFGRRGPLGGLLEALGLPLAFTTAAVVMAQVFVSAPLFVRAAALGFRAVDPDIERAAMLDGARPWQVFRHVTLPLARPALLGGAVLGWARALGEFGATIIFAGNFPGRTQTMPLAIYMGFEVDLDTAVALSAILIACALAAMVGARHWMQRQGPAAEG